jgi:N-acetylglucosamine kinase-like BadF-type ATPase
MRPAASEANAAKRPGGGWVLGADGGNTKSVVVVADETGVQRGFAFGGNTDIYTAPSDVALGELARLCTDALAEAGATGTDLAAAAFSLAGADWPEDITLLADEVRTRVGLAVDPIVVNDALGGMRLGAPEFEGIGIVCGTFNAVCARHRDGAVFHCGFWPDRTGGYDLAQEALRAVYREALDLGPATTLTKHLCEHYLVDDGWELMHLFNARGAFGNFTAHETITPLLLDEAEGGDEVARALVVQSGNWLGDQGRASAQRVGLDLAGAPVVFTGGVLNHPSTLIVDTAMQHLPGAVVVRPTAPPVVGALLLAFDQLGLRPDISHLEENL